MSKKVGICTSTIVHRRSLSKSNGKYILKKDEKDSIKELNSRKGKMKKEKVICVRCHHLKDASFCLRREVEIKEKDYKDLKECKFMSKI